MNNEQKERRERIATEVLAGIATYYMQDHYPKPDHDWRTGVAIDAIMFADALIAELDAPRETKPYEDGEPV